MPESSVTIPPAPKPTEQQIAMCKAECGPMGDSGFHSLLCPLSGVDHPSRPGNTFRPETLEQEKERVFGTCGGKCGEAPCVEWNKAKAFIAGHDVAEETKRILDFGHSPISDRTAIGNTPTCEDCGKAQDHCICDTLEMREMSEEQKQEYRLDQLDEAERESTIPEHVLPPINTFIDITPKGLKTPEGIKRVNEAMAYVDKTTAEVADLATQMVDRLASNQQWFCAENDRLKAAIQERRNAQYALVMALSDRPGRADDEPMDSTLKIVQSVLKDRRYKANR